MGFKNQGLNQFSPRNQQRPHVPLHRNQQYNYNNIYNPFDNNNNDRKDSDDSDDDKLVNRILPELRQNESVRVRMQPTTQVTTRESIFNILEEQRRDAVDLIQQLYQQYIKWVAYHLDVSHELNEVITASIDDIILND